MPTDERDTICAAAAALRRGALTSRDLVERCLARIDEWEPRVHAWVLVDREGARLRARELDAESRSGAWRSPLHGIPIGIKDLVDMAGFPTGAGSRRMAQTVAKTDATIIRKLRDAGAILLGKTVTTQFACFDPPPTRNPWNLDRTPGGSSSGSAAGVATGMCLAAIGSQTGGSITRPAAYCGVAGCKPSFGRVSRTGIVPVSESLDHPGPIGRCVADLALLLDAISGHDPKDRDSVVSEAGPIAAAESNSESLPPPRLARLRGFFETRAEPSVRAAIDASLALWQSRGAVIIEGKLPASFDDVHRQHQMIVLFELAARHRVRFREFRDDYLPALAGLIETGLTIPESTYREARRRQAGACAEIAGVFGDADAAVCPAAPNPAPDPSTTGDPLFNSPWSYTGLPTVSFPNGMSADGLPIGIQLVGRRHDERRLFRAALWCERALPAARNLAAGRS